MNIVGVKLKIAILRIWFENIVIKALINE